LLYQLVEVFLSIFYLSGEVY